ncbi:MAG: response regulator [Nitrospinales bacterium]
MKVFITEKSESIFKRIVNLVSQIDGIEILKVEEKALSAIDSIRTLKPDVILLDMYLLGGTGKDVLMNIKNMNPVSKIILMIDQPFEGYRTNLKKIGADFVFNKSLEFEKIVPTLIKLMGKVSEEAPFSNNRNKRNTVEDKKYVKDGK